VKYYKNGTHLETPACNGIFTTCRAKHVTLDAAPGFGISLDGEIVEGTHFEIDVLPSAIRLAVPVNVPEQKK